MPCTMWNFRVKSLQQFNLVKHSINYILDHQNLLVFSTSFHCGLYGLLSHYNWQFDTYFMSARKTKQDLNVIQILYKMTESLSMENISNLFGNICTFAPDIPSLSWVFLIIALRRQKSCDLWSTITFQSLLVQCKVHFWGL